MIGLPHVGVDGARDKAQAIVMDLGLSGKHALVTGASKGIGLAVTPALIAEGAHVVVAAARPAGRVVLLP